MHIRDCREVRVCPESVQLWLHAGGRSLSTEVREQTDYKTLLYNFILRSYMYDKHGGCSGEKHTVCRR